MNYLVLSTSLHEDSRSRLLCRALHDILDAEGKSVTWLDLRTLDPLICGGNAAWNHPATHSLKQAIASADGILLGLGVYNYAASAAAKTVVELGGDAWSDKIVGFACAAGGASSMMAPMSLANSLMLDFRSVIIPRFVYATTECFSDDAITDDSVRDRLGLLAQDLTRMTHALRSEPAATE